MTTTALFPGTFDPLTLGHLDLLARSAGLFPRVLLAVARAHHKQTLFTLDERLALAREACAAWPQIEVLPFDGLLTAFMRTHGASVVVRGVRGVVDFDYESQLAGMNRQLLPGMETIFLLPDDVQRHTSSTLVREIAKLGGEVTHLVPPAVLAALHAKLGKA